MRTSRVNFDQIEISLTFQPTVISPIHRAGNGISSSQQQQPISLAPLPRSVFPTFDQHNQLFYPALASSSQPSSLTSAVPPRTEARYGIVDSIPGAKDVISGFNGKSQDFANRRSGFIDVNSSFGFSDIKPEFNDMKSGFIPRQGQFNQTVQLPAMDTQFQSPVKLSNTNGTKKDGLAVKTGKTLYFTRYCI